MMIGESQILNAGILIVDDQALNVSLPVQGLDGAGYLAVLVLTAQPGQRREVEPLG